MLGVAALTLVLLFFAARRWKREREVHLMRESLLGSSSLSSSPDVPECSFFFLSAAELRSGRVDALPVFQDALQVPGLLSTQTVNLRRACLGEYAATHLAVSHRWEEPGAPDSQGEQCRRLCEFLRSPQGRRFEYVCERGRRSIPRRAFAPPHCASPQRRHSSTAPRRV